MKSLFCLLGLALGDLSLGDASPPWNFALDGDYPEPDAFVWSSIVFTDVSGARERLDPVIEVFSNSALESI